MSVRRLAFPALKGWAGDDHGAALAAYSSTVDLLGADWPRTNGSDARDFFESHFVPVLIGDPPGLLTGYYEPELAGSLIRTGGFRYPLHAKPYDLPADRPWFSRAEITAQDLLAGHELIWLDSAVEAFLAQVQGSVRVRLPDGTLRRFGFAAKNGHPYHSIGAELVRLGEVPAGTISSQAIRDWCAAHPGRVGDLLNHNPSYVFFRPLDLGEADGPIGAMGRSVRAYRSLAVDPDHVPLGAPVWVEGGDIATLMIAQDIGSAIKGTQRGDIFCGSGLDAGLRASGLRLSGRLVTLLPHGLAEGII